MNYYSTKYLSNGETYGSYVLATNETDAKKLMEERGFKERIDWVRNLDSGPWYRANILKRFSNIFAENPAWHTIAQNILHQAAFLTFCAVARKNSPYDNKAEVFLSDTSPLHTVVHFMAIWLPHYEGLLDEEKIQRSAGYAIRLNPLLRKLEDATVGFYLD